jgi:hypothetical protein
VGGDIVLSCVVADGPAVQGVIADVAKREEAVALKGFDRPVGFVRLLQAPLPR